MAKSETILSILLILTMLSLASLGTFAYLNDVETSTGNVFTAGTLDLEVIGDSSPLQMVFNNMAPGDGMTGSEHGGIKYNFRVKNVGTLDGTLTITVVNVKNYENGRNEPELAVDTTGGDPGLGNGELGGYLIMQINQPLDGFIYNHCGNPSGNCAGDGRGHTINCWEDYVITCGTLSAGASRLGVFEFMLPFTVGDIIQSDSIEFSIIFHLDQVV